MTKTKAEVMVTVVKLVGNSRMRRWLPLGRQLPLLLLPQGWTSASCVDAGCSGLVRRLLMIDQAMKAPLLLQRRLTCRSQPIRLKARRRLRPAWVVCLATPRRPPPWEGKLSCGPLASNRCGNACPSSGWPIL